jgi:prepilin-type N-terminal cleavage/methylation domain-containing protein
MRMSAALRWRRRPRSRGLTLIELVVVLVVLVALAGILVPLFPGMIQRSHGASGADSVTEILKTVQLHQALYGGYPDGLDSLIATNEADELVLAPTLQTPGGVLVGPFDTDEVAPALQKAGIKTSYKMLYDPLNATFAAHDGGTFNVQHVGGGGKFIALSDDAAISLGLSPTVNSPDPIVAANSKILSYVVFGLGNQSTAIGKTMADAPVRFLADGKSPSDVYARWLLVFEIPRDPAGSARLAAVIGTDATAVKGLSGHLNSYYQSANQ